MTDEFGKVGDSDQGLTPTEGNNFGQTPGDDTPGDTDNKGMTSEELEALRQRDEHAQKHIPTLERENSELRDKIAELEDKLSSATTIDEALDRIRNKGEGEQLRPDDVAKMVESVLEQKQTESTQESNWTKVQNKLTEVYGDWKTADAKVQARAQELDIQLQDASTMARKNPTAFMELFVPKEAANIAGTGSVRSGGDGQKSPGTTASGEVRDQAWYSKLRRENPNKYWSVETQAQYRRDVFNQ